MKLDGKLDTKTIAGLRLPDRKDEEIFWDGELENYGCRLRRNKSGKIRKTLVIQHRRGGRSPRIKLGAAEVLGGEQGHPPAGLAQPRDRPPGRIAGLRDHDRWQATGLRLLRNTRDLPASGVAV